jgi:hypothetical protein
MFYGAPENCLWGSTKLFVELRKPGHGVRHFVVIGPAENCLGPPQHTLETKADFAVHGLGMASPKGAGSLSALCQEPAQDPARYERFFHVFD